MASNTITEHVVQPRTGSMCPLTGANRAAGSTSVCQGSNDDSKQISWDYVIKGPALTLGYVSTVDTVGGNAMTECKKDPSLKDRNAWAFGNLSGSKNGPNRTMCIKPVEQLCYLDGNWDGMDYNPETWTPNQLKGPFKGANFMFDCENSSSKTQYGGEFPMMAQMCPVECQYDATKFTTLDQIEAYEKKYGKYLDDTARCFKGDKSQTYIRNCLSNVSSSGGQKVTGNPLYNTPNYSPVSPNYETIMQHFCSQMSTNCTKDPITGNPSPKCSTLMSTGPEGDKCRAWLHMYGPYKFTQMQQIGNNYCTLHPDSNDCMCFSKTNPDNPNSKDFITIRNKINSATGGVSGGIAPACYYLPCADATQYIVGTDDFTPPGTSGYYSVNYGYQCADNVCTQIIDSGANTIMDNNSLYVSCGTGEDSNHHTDDGGGGSDHSNGKHSNGGSSGGGIGGTDLSAGNVFMIIGVILAGIIIIGALAYFVYKLYLKKKNAVDDVFVDDGDYELEDYSNTPSTPDTPDTPSTTDTPSSPDTPPSTVLQDY